jgi:glycosyltransferase involved in cell wall biosynthesis
VPNEAQRPRFSVVIPVRDRADAIGRAVTGVLAQTFADVEVVVVDDGSTDDTVPAARAVADRRVHVVRQDPAGPAAALGAGLDIATGRWAAVLDADTTVAPSWLARIGRLVDATGARFVTCGGDQVHLDGSRTDIVPRPTSSDPLARACLRTGAFATERSLLVAAMDRPDTDPIHHGARPATVAGGEALRAVLDEGGEVAQTPERLVTWHDRHPDPAPRGDALRLEWAFQSLDVLARSPIPDAELLARYATIGGVAAARLRRRADARLLFRIAFRSRPEIRKHWARFAVSCVPPLSDRIWDPTAAAEDRERMDRPEPGTGAVPVTS